MFSGGLRMIVRGTILVSAALFLTKPAAYGRCGAVRKTAPRAVPVVVETANFRIYGIGGLRDANRVGKDLEALRAGLARTWLGDAPLRAWSPKCEVAIHATAEGYLRAVGQDQFATQGASRIDLTGPRVSRRRIDIRADRAGWLAEVAPHELTHVIMADEFLGCELPHWADEGMALLADTAHKQSLHLRDLEAAYRNGRTFRLAEFVSRTCYPAAEQISVFYGQSISLVSFLVDRRWPTDFMRFLHRSQKIGSDAAIAEVYGWHGVAELERMWLAAVAASARPSNALASVSEQPTFDLVLPADPGTHIPQRGRVRARQAFLVRCPWSVISSWTTRCHGQLTTGN